MHVGKGKQCYLNEGGKKKKKPKLRQNRKKKNWLD